MTNRNRVRLSQLSLGLAIALAAAPAFAQNTSAAVSGRIVSSDEQPVTGAQVTILHTPSGTVSNAVTGGDGRYSARGLRVGGPYTITIVKDGVTEVREGVYLQLAETTAVDATLGQDAATTLETVEVTGVATGSDVFSTTNFGTGTNISSEDLSGLPSIQRDLQDYARLDPRLSQTDKDRGEISAGGQNSRYNSITVDSVSISDTFGLEANNLPTIRQPISIDAIAAVQVNIANYDTTQRGYTGANINAITKSGTNEFDGSVYGTYRTKDWVREEDDRGVIFNRFEDEKMFGATFGGPIAKDKLFFFLNYEKTTLGGIAPDLASGPLGRGAITAQNIADVITEATRRGFTPGDLTSSAPETEVETALGRFDWNINDDHRLAFRFSRTEQTEAVLPGFGANFLSLSSYWYDQGKTIDNYVVELFSDWSDSFSTEARVSLREYASEPNIFARQPQVQVDFGPANMRFGAEQFRHTNVLETDTLNAFFAGNLFLGEHEVKFGLDYEKNDIYNLFLESNFGTYRFSSLTNFRNGIYRDYALRVSPTGNPNDAAANFALENVGLFLQDTWAVNYNLTLTYGVRFDSPIMDDAVPYNAAFNTAFGMRNDETVDGANLIQPRFGFNYTLDSERPTQFRGGIGLFQGAAANVWLSNSYTNNGLTIAVFGCGTGFNASCTGAPPPSANPDAQPRFGGARADVDLVEPGFEQPSVWKANLAFDHELPWAGLVLGAELLITDVKSGIYYEHLNLGRVIRPGVDGRNMYWASTNPALYGLNTGFFGPTTNARSGANAAFREVLVARNTDKGRGENFTVSLEKPFNPENNWSWTVAYSFTDATEVNGLTSSRAISNWRSQAAFNVNENVDSQSAYVNRDRFLANVSYRMHFFGDYKTQVSMFYEGRAGKPYSWVFNNDMNGDGQAGNDLLYIPNPDEVRFVTPADRAAFYDILARNGLTGYQGSVVPRNSERAPWVNSFDVRISQELPGFAKGNKAEIWLDVLNIGNLLNKDWGLIDEVGFQSDGGQARSFVNFAGIDPVTGQYVYAMPRTSTGAIITSEEALLRRDNRGESRWAAQIGFRYSF